MRSLPLHLTRSHHFFAAAHKILGDGPLASLWKKSRSQVERWCSDPTSFPSHSRNPIDLLTLTLKELQQRGREELVECTLRIVAEPFGYEVHPQKIAGGKGAGESLLACTAALGLVAEYLPEGFADQHKHDNLTASALTRVFRCRELLDAIQKGRA